MTDITIPPEALEAVAMEMAPHPWSMYTDAAKEHFRDKARAACIAMLRSWPGMLRSWPGTTVNDGCPVWHAYPHIILPLPQESGE